VTGVSNTSSANNLSTTVNGVVGTAVNMVNSISNTSSANNLSTTVNGVASTAVNIINSNVLSLSTANLTSTVNGVASTTLDLTPAITSKAWAKVGNSGTSPATDFLGTTDAQSLAFRTNNTERISVLSTGEVGIGTTTPAQKLEVKDGHALLSNSDNTARELRFAEPSTSGSNYTAFKAQAQAADITYTLPAADGTSGQYLKTNGSGTLSWAAATLTGVGATTYVIKSADESVTSSSSTQDDDELFFAVGANEKWLLEAMLFVDGNAGHIKYAIDLPSGSMKVDLKQWAGTGVGNTPHEIMTTDNIDTTVSFDINNTGTSSASLNGIISTSATAGNVKIRWAQRSSNGTSTFVRQNSYLKATRLQ
jgi:hypothetical protein